MPQNGARSSPLTAWRVVGAPVNASAAATLIPSGTVRGWPSTVMLRSGLHAIASLLTQTYREPGVGRQWAAFIEDLRRQRFGRGRRGGDAQPFMAQR